MLSCFWHALSLEFHANSREESGLRGIVNQAVLCVIHVEIAVACLQENVAREIEANRAAGEPCDLRACSESADIALQGEEEPASEVNLSTETNDRIDPPLVAGPRCWETVFELLGKGLGKPLLGLSDASLSPGLCLRIRASTRARSCSRRASMRARSLRLEHRRSVDKRADFAADSFGYTENIRGAKRTAERTTARPSPRRNLFRSPTHSRDDSVPNILLQDATSSLRIASSLAILVRSFCSSAPTALWTRALTAPRCAAWRRRHLLNAGIVNARVNINPEVVIACARVNIDEAAPVVDDSVSERKLHHSLLKLDIRVIVKRPGRIAARRELGEKSIAQDAPFSLPHFAFGHDSPVEMLDHGQRIIINVSVKPLHADGAVHAECPQVGFEDERPAVGILAGNNFEAIGSRNDSAQMTRPGRRLSVSARFP